MSDTNKHESQRTAETAQTTPYFLGVDGGGSKTLAIIVDAQGNERGRGTAGSSNHTSVGLQSALENLRGAIDEATHAAGCQLPVHAAWIGLAGIDRPHDYETLFPLLRPLAQVVRLVNDAELLLSALDNTVGVALIAGTGSIALGRDASGRTVRAGGWGYVLGDEGSGFEIGRLALQAAVRAADGRGPKTRLLDLILQHWQIKQADDIIGQVYPDPDTGRIARLSSLVFAAASEGDQAASAIVQHAADELALAAIVVGAQLSFAEAHIPLAFGGGLLVHETALRTRVLERIREQRPIGQLAIVEQPALSAAHAAIHLIV